MKVLAEGIVYGKVQIVKETVNTDNSVDFLFSIKMALDQIEELKKANPENSAYLDVHKYLIDDPVFKNEVLKMIGNGNDSVSSVKYVFSQYLDELSRSSDEYLKERTLDIKDVMNRILSNLSEKKEYILTEKCIVLVEDLLPSFLIRNKKNILGVISRKGGSTSHSAILCRGWNIPYVVSDLILADGDYVLIDNDIIEINPSFNRVNKINPNCQYKELAVHEGYGFFANVFSNEDIDYIDRLGFDGVGLYRTEFIFMDKNRALSLEEQINIYQGALAKTNKDIYFRTFDVGDDKSLSFINCQTKGINNYLNNLDFFETQIKALVIAGAKYIMFPMINNRVELKVLKNIVCKYSKSVRIGIMLETKDALANLSDFFDVDFISIGTNDLVESLYHITRGKQLECLDYLNNLLTEIKRVVEFCRNNKIKLSICGELASLESVIIELFKVGINNISINISKTNNLNNGYYKYINE